MSKRKRAALRTQVGTGGHTTDNPPRVRMEVAERRGRAVTMPKRPPASPAYGRRRRVKAAEASVMGVSTAERDGRDAGSVGGVEAS